MTDEQIDAAMLEADWPPSLLAPVIKAKLRQFARAILSADRGEPVATFSAPTVLPDGSAFATASWPLPKDHWLYAPSPDGWDNERDCMPDLPRPILTHAVAKQVQAALRYAIRAATMNGKEPDFDPDALVQNATVALCGFFGTAAAPSTPQPAPELLPPISYATLYAFAERHKISYNALCSAVRSALATPQPAPEQVPVETLLEWAVLDGVVRLSKVMDADLQDALRKFASRFGATPQPDTVQVPREPTHDMLYAMAELDGWQRGDRDHPMFTKWEDYWNAAIAAAPKP